jgi:hypothetical protein
MSHVRQPVLRFLLLLALFVVLPSTTFAGDQEEDDGEDDRHWGISIWGLSYHVDKSIDYDENNWGLGIRYQARQRWLGRKEDNRIFLELDALRNSHRGMVIPLSVGVDYQIVSFPGGCKLLAIGAFTVAYYENRREGATELKFGPVPGLTLAWDHVRTNMVLILRGRHTPLAAIVGSLTIVF